MQSDECQAVPRTICPPAGRGKGGLKRASVPNQCLQGFCAVSKRTGEGEWYALKSDGPRPRRAGGRPGVMRSKWESVYSVLLSFGQMSTRSMSGLGQEHF